MRIACIGDLHYPSMIGKSEKVKAARDTFYTEFLQSFFNIEADYYVSTGDLTNFGQADELREVYGIIRKHDKPFIHAFGNHDLLGVSKEEVLEITNSRQNISIDTDQAKIISLETARDHELVNCSGYLTNEQLTWLEEEITQSGEKPLFIFAHHPVFDTTVKSNFKYRSILPEIPILDVLWKKQGNAIYVNGHNHKDSMEVIENWTFVQSSAVLDDCTIRIFEIDENTISIQSVDVGTPELADMAQIIGSNIDYFSLNPFGKGTTLNREKVIRKELFI